MNAQNEAYSYRSDPAVPEFSAGEFVTVMDARCALCARGAAWIARNDRDEKFRIIPMQSNLGTALMRHYGMDPEDPVSWLYLELGVAHHSLGTFIRVSGQLGGRWRLLSVLYILPRGVRDWLYRLVARNRYRIFGTADMCAMPDKGVQQRLLQ